MIPEVVIYDAAVLGLLVIVVAVEVFGSGVVITVLSSEVISIGAKELTVVVVVVVVTVLVLGGVAATVLALGVVCATELALGVVAASVFRVVSVTVLFLPTTKLIS